MVCVKTPEEVLIGFPPAAGMFNGHEAWDQAKDLGRSALGLPDKFFVRDEVLRRGCHRSFDTDRHFRDLEFLLIGIMRQDAIGRGHRQPG
jgi:hypothetical protein